MSYLHRFCCLSVLALVVIWWSGCNRSAQNADSGDKERAGKSESDSDASNGAADESQFFRGHTASIRFMTFSADGKRLLTASSGHTFTPSDGKLAETPADDRSARVWDSSTGKEIARFDRHENGAVCAALSPDGKLAATADGTKVRVWAATAEAEQKHEFSDSEKNIVALCFSTDGKRLASAGEDMMIRLWDLDSGNPLGAWKANDVADRGLTFSPDNKYLVTASENRLEVWDAARTVPLRELLEVHPLAAQFAAGSNTLLVLLKAQGADAAGSAQTKAQPIGAMLLEWNLESGNATTHDPVTTAGVEQAALAPDGSKFIVGASPHNGRMLVHVYDIPKKKEVGQFAAPHPGGLRPEPSVLMAIAPRGLKAAIAVYRTAENDAPAGQPRPVGSIDTVKMYDLPK